MTIATFIKMPGRLRRLREGPLGTHLELLCARLLTEGHCQERAWSNIKVIDDFGRWLERQGIAIKRIDEAIVDHYLRFRLRYRHSFPADRPALNRFCRISSLRTG